MRTNLILPSVTGLAWLGLQCLSGVLGLGRLVKQQQPSHLPLFAGSSISMRLIPVLILCSLPSLSGLQGAGTYVKWPLSSLTQCLTGQLWRSHSPPTVGSQWNEIQPDNSDMF